MSINQDRLKYLLEQYAEKTAIDEEVQEMFALIKAANEADVEGIKMFLNETLAATEPATNYDHKRWNKVLANIISPMEPSVPAAHGTDTNGEAMPGKVRRLHVWKRVAAAACITLLVGASWYFLSNKPENLKPIEVVQTHDVKPPASNRATITLANGKVVYLDSANNGALAQQGSVSLQKLADGQIVYTGTSTTASVTYNTLSNPRGSKVIDMTLNDGTRVWLNAGSSVTYPVAFVGNERKVSMNGEAYFEVVHNIVMPFKVSKGEMEVTVLGTHFNVNAYDDEGDIKVTLLEGSVKTSIVNGQSLMVKPGEQAVTMDNGKLKIEKGIDTDAVMAWKNGYFNFKGAGIDVIMRQMARWYDVDIAFEYKTNQVFVAEIPRNVNASDFFRILEATGWVNFKIEGRKVTVLK